MITHTEKEISFVLDYKHAECKLGEIHDFLIGNNHDLIAPHQYIDRYLNKNHRIRKITYDTYSKSEKFELTVKEGDKYSGERKEITTETNGSVFDFINDNKCLEIIKNRYVFNYNECTISIDFVSSPMKIGIIEIEGNDDIKIIVTRQMLGLDEYKTCPLSAYDYFKRKITVCGGPSSGKSETAKRISSILNCDYGCNSFHAIEYATTFIQKYKRFPSFTDQFFMWLGQKEREQSAQKANIVITDCPTFLGYIYMQHMKTKDELNAENVMYFAKIYKRVLQDVLDYDHIIFLQLQNYVENGIRYQTQEEALYIQEKIRTFLDDHKIKYVTATYYDAQKLIDEMFYINK